MQPTLPVLHNRLYPHPPFLNPSLVNIRYRARASLIIQPSTSENLFSKYRLSVRIEPISSAYVRDESIGKNTSNGANPTLYA